MSPPALLLSQSAPLTCCKNAIAQVLRLPAASAYRFACIFKEVLKFRGYLHFLRIVSLAVSSVLVLGGTCKQVEAHQHTACCAIIHSCSACLTTTRWHIQDLALGAMNCMAWGAPKLWLLATTREAADRLLALLASKLGGEQQAQQLLLHKQLLFHDVSLQEALSCGLVPFVQQPGTAVFTLPVVQSIHVTISSGFSVAVSGNNFFSSTTSLQEHIAGLQEGPLGSVLFPARPAEGGWDRGHVEARERLAPLLAKLAEAQHSTAS
jgi:hypothetical protein